MFWIFFLALSGRMFGPNKVNFPMIEKLLSCKPTSLFDVYINVCVFPVWSGLGSGLKPDSAFPIVFFDQIQLFYYSFIWAAASDMRDDGSFWELDYNVSVDTDDWAGPLVLLIQME